MLARQTDVVKNARTRGVMVPAPEIPGVATSRMHEVEAAIEKDPYLGEGRPC